MIIMIVMGIAMMIIIIKAMMIMNTIMLMIMVRMTIKMTIIRITRTVATSFSTIGTMEQMPTIAIRTTTITATTMITATITNSGPSTMRTQQSYQ